MIRLAPLEHRLQVDLDSIPDTIYIPKIVRKRARLDARDAGRKTKKKRLASKKNNVVTRPESSFRNECPLSVLPEDCRISILKFLDPHFLHGSFALVSRRCLDDCRNPALPQTRTCEIVCTTKSRVTDVLYRIIEWNIRDVFASPRHRLKVKGHEHLGKVTMGDKRLKTLLHTSNDDGGLDSVTSLDLSFPSDHWNTTVQNCVPKILSIMLTNLREVDMSYMNVRHTAAADFSMRHFESLRVFHWNGATGGFSYSGQDLRHCSMLQELYIDHACMYSPENSIFKEGVLEHCSSNLERVSFKSPTYKLFGQRCARSVPEECIMEFVRNAKKLKWFRSDLSPENVAVLQKERPEVYFSP